MVEQNLTYLDMCQVITNDWNKEGKTQITAQDLWEEVCSTRFPSLYCLQMYNAAETGNLIGLLLSDNTCAKIFCKILDKKQH